MADITIVTGVYKPTYNWGAPSCMFGASWSSHFSMAISGTRKRFIGGTDSIYNANFSGLCKGIYPTKYGLNVNPGLIKPKRLFNWGGTIFQYQMKWLLEEYPPNCHKPWFSLIRGWHYMVLTVPPCIGSWFFTIDFWWNPETPFPDRAQTLWAMPERAQSPQVHRCVLQGHRKAKHHACNVPSENPFFFSVGTWFWGTFFLHDPIQLNMFINFLFDMFQVIEQAPLKIWFCSRIIWQLMLDNPNPNDAWLWRLAIENHLVS